ncbi:hypothetical protein [Nocardia donostiensis]|uniref:DUF8020 domain-containing protein n=1 Tax=Nocardia donostiensis TaxID=1538463 RepID=A0A1V2TK27_9NOCA|nr:hypothetical protein [Nocardia donostiensis]ONM49832.1 hypothetical protein B0T46_05395 [Nocardia donostiensis]OQS22216.1 hypothetical protein B0T44_06140 [Nocardia donostiensis]
MKFEKITAAVFMAVSAVSITAATAQAKPAITEQPTTVTTGGTIFGVDHGINYQITVSPVDKTIVTTVENGKFEIAQNGAVVLESSDGAAVIEVPQRYAVAGRSIAIAQHIGADGRTLTLTPTPTAEDVAHLKDISSYDRLQEQINKNLPGVVSGAIVGGLLGAIPSLFFWISIPVGVLIGGIVGGYIQGGPEFLDAVQAFVTGQP